MSEMRFVYFVFALHLRHQFPNK